jgi:hypothetical protein
MDHDRYAYSNLFKRKSVRWPNDAALRFGSCPLGVLPLDMAPKGVCRRSGLERPSRLWNYAAHWRRVGSRICFN